MAAKTKQQAQAAAADDARADALGAFLKQMEKDKPGEVRALSDESIVDIDVFPTGAISLDVALGIGGIPRGRITEMYGPTGSGKTTLAISAAVNCQRQGGNIGFIDAEHALSRELCLNMGVDPDRFVIYQPDHGEDAVEMCQSMLESGAFDMVVVDSVASMTPKAEMDADVEQHGMAHHARLMSKFMRRITSLVSSTDTALVLLNQVRTNLGQYGAPDTSTGGKAIPFFSTIRIEVRTSNSKRIERNKEFVGTTVTARVIKNKLASPFRQAEYDIMFGKGIEAGGSLLAVCEKLGLITRAGSSYTDATTGAKLGVGKDKVKALIEGDEELQARLTESVYAALQAKANVFGSDAEEYEAGNDGVAAADALPEEFGDGAEILDDEVA